MKIEQNEEGVTIRGEESDSNGKLSDSKELDCQWGNNIIVDISDDPANFNIKTQWGSNFYIQIKTDNPEEMKSHLKQIFENIGNWIKNPGLTYETTQKNAEEYPWRKDIIE